MKALAAGKKRSSLSWDWLQLYGFLNLSLLYQTFNPFLFFFKVPSIQRVVDIFIYIIPFNMFVYLGLALSQNVAAFPYLIWG